MTQPQPQPALAPEVPSLSRAALAGRPERPGFRIFVPGACLKVDSKLWTSEQRVHGVFLKGVYLSASEELEALADAQREGKAIAVGVFQVIKSISAVADVVEVASEEGDAERGPGPWKAIPGLEKRPYWEELGPMGRNLFTQGFQLANTPEEAHRAMAQASFRVIG